VIARADNKANLSPVSSNRGFAMTGGVPSGASFICLVRGHENRESGESRAGGFLNTRAWPVVVFVVIFVFLSIASPSFLTTTNHIGLVRQWPLLCIVAVGMTFLIIAGGIDLSVGSANAVTGVLCALVVLWVPRRPRVLCGVAAGGLIGLANGMLVTGIGLPPLQPWA
jgi:ribose/xylose/arabinose/galactoside ABC-type transport system permease subunit